MVSAKLVRRSVLVAIAVLVLAGAGYIAPTVVEILFHECKGDMPPASAFAFDPAFAIPRKTAGGVEYTVNNSTASFDLDVEEPDEHCGRVFKDNAAAAEYCRSRGLRFLPSVNLVQGKCKSLDDRLCAALEAAVQRGIEGMPFPGKRETLRRLLGKLRELRASTGIPQDAIPAFDDALVHVATALALGGALPDLEPALAGRVETEKARFLADNPVESRPIGFWTASEELRGIFQQDRYLMRGLRLSEDMAPAIAIAAALHEEPALLEAIERLREFDGKLTNPTIYLDVDEYGAPEAPLIPWRELVQRAAPPGAERSAVLAAARPEASRRLAEDLAREHGREAGMALVAYSRSKEYGLLHSLFQEGRLSGAAVTMELIIEAVRSGRLLLEPRPDSGWYDHQVHALETLLLPERGPESAKLTLTDAYRERLRNAFAAILTKQRETHIKHLPVFSFGKGVGPPPKVEIGPEFTVEPTATVYLRLARGYRFLRTALGAVLGEEAMRAIRIARQGSPPADRSVGEDLEGAALLLYGIYETVCLEIGQRPAYLEGEMAAGQVEKAKAAAAAWLSSPGADPDLAADSRFAVPILSGPITIVHWSTCGVRLDRIVARYDREPIVSREVEPVFIPTRWYAPADIFVEFAGPGPAPLTRDEFRAICDRAGDEAGLRRALGAPPRISRRPWGFWSITAAAALAALAAAYGLHRLFPRFRPGRWILRCFTWRKLLLGAGIIVLAILLFALAIVVFPGFRVKFLVTQLAARNQNLAVLCEYRWVSCIDSRHKVPALVDLLDHPDPQVRYLAAYFLLFSSSFGNREGTEKAFADPSIMKALQRAAGDPVPEVAVFSLDLLGAYKDPCNVDFLLGQLRESRSMDRMCTAALSALSEIGDPRALDAVLPLTRDPRSNVRGEAIASLGGYDDPRAETRIREVLVSSDADSVRAADTALSWIVRADLRNDGRFDDALVAAAGRADLPYWLRFECVIEKIVDPGDQVKALQAIVRFPSSDRSTTVDECRASALDRLGRLDANGKSALEKFAQDPDEGMRAAAQEALQRILEIEKEEQQKKEQSDSSQRKKPR